MSLGLRQLRDLGFRANLGSGEAGLPLSELRDPLLCPFLGVCKPADRLVELSELSLRHRVSQFLEHRSEGVGERLGRLLTERRPQIFVDAIGIHSSCSKANSSAVR